MTEIYAETPKDQRSACLQLEISEAELEDLAILARMDSRPIEHLAAAVIRGYLYGHLGTLEMMRGLRGGMPRDASGPQG
jgi:hypothetical protein